MEGSKIDSLIQLTKCKVGICQSKIKYYCQKHEKLICRDCYIKFHMKCELIHSIDTKLICSVFSNLVSKLDEIYDYNSKSDFSSRFEDLNDELKKYFDNLDEIKCNLTGLKCKYKDKMFAQIYDKILKLYKEFLSSQLYIEYLMDKDSVISSPYSIVDVSKIQKDNTNKPSEDTKKDELIESLQRKVEILEDKIISIEQNVNENLKCNYNNEDCKTDLSINERESNVINTFLGYYSNDFGFNESSVLKIDMSIDRQYDLIKFLAHNKIRIPNIYGLKISNVSSSCGYLKNFFKYCFPNNLKFFCFNYGYKNWIHLDVYEELFPQLLKVEEEIFLYVCRFTKTEIINKFIKNARNCKNVIMRACSINTTSSCNFNLESNLEYKTKLISFGHSHPTCDHTGFLRDNSKFKNFIDGVKGCQSLLSSLKTIQIDEAQLPSETAITILQQTPDISSLFNNKYCAPSI